MSQQERTGLGLSLTTACIAPSIWDRAGGWQAVWGEGREKAIGGGLC